MTSYIAFLLGINVGGNRKVPMAGLRSLLEGAGYSDVRTLLASGNVLLRAKEDAASLSANLETIIESHFGFFVGVIVRSQDQIATLIESDPFANVQITPDIRINVTFTTEPIAGIKCDFPAGVTEVSRSACEVCWVVNLAESGTVDVMKSLNKALGKKITTRTWNMVLKTCA